MRLSSVNVFKITTVQKFVFSEDYMLTNYITHPKVHLSLSFTVLLSRYFINKQGVVFLA